MREETGKRFVTPDCTVVHPSSHATLSEEYIYAKRKAEAEDSHQGKTYLVG